MATWVDHEFSFCKLEMFVNTSTLKKSRTYSYDGEKNWKCIEDDV